MTATAPSQISKALIDTIKAHTDRLAAEREAETARMTEGIAGQTGVAKAMAALRADEQKRQEQIAKASEQGAVKPQSVIPPVTPVDGQAGVRGGGGGLGAALEIAQAVTGGGAIKRGQAGAGPAQTTPGINPGAPGTSQSTTTPIQEPLDTRIKRGVANALGNRLRFGPVGNTIFPSAGTTTTTTRAPTPAEQQSILAQAANREAPGLETRLQAIDEATTPEERAAAQEKFAEDLRNVAKRGGPEVAQLAEFRARQNRLEEKQVAAAESLRAAQASQRIAERQRSTKLLAEAIKQSDASQQVKQRVAEIQLRFGETGEISQRDKDFVDFVARTNPLTALFRDALQGVEVSGGQGEETPTFNDAFVSQVQDDLTSELGRAPTPEEMQAEFQARGVTPTGP